MGYAYYEYRLSRQSYVSMNTAYRRIDAAVSRFKKADIKREGTGTLWHVLGDDDFIKLVDQELASAGIPVVRKSYGYGTGRLLSEEETRDWFYHGRYRRGGS